MQDLTPNASQCFLCYAIKGVPAVVVSWFKGDTDQLERIAWSRSGG